MSESRQVVVASMDDITLELVPVPEPGAGEVRVSTRVVGICGSDMHAALGRHPFIDLPYRPGHEAVGVVDSVGAGVGDFAPGDRVLLEPNLACGHCHQCRSGRYNICETLEVFGCQTRGALADQFVVAADRLHHVPDGMTDVQAALVEPLSTPVHATRRAGDLTGRRVLVLGAGPIGLFLLLTARHAGAAAVAVTDLLESKRARALRLGADAALPADATDLPAEVAGALDGPVDVVFDCVSRSGSIEQAITTVTKGGTVVVVGVALSGTTPVRLDLIQDREIDVRGCLMFTREDVETSIRLLAGGAVDVDEVVTATYPLEQAGAAFRASTQPEQVKVLVTVDAS